MCSSLLPPCLFSTCLQLCYVRLNPISFTHVLFVPALGACSLLCTVCMLGTCYQHPLSPFATQDTQPFDWDTPVDLLRKVKVKIQTCL